MLLSPLSSLYFVLVNKINISLFLEGLYQGINFFIEKVVRIISIARLCCYQLYTYNLSTSSSLTILMGSIISK